jgi:two-component system, OmpR family, sensor kinase
VGKGDEVIVVGQSLDDRDETLAALAGAFALGAPAAAIVVALLGYALAAAGLRPVERIRRRAEEVSLEGEAEPLPLPAARDEIRRLGETLNAMLDRLRGSYARERRFVADASHELRTPVAVIKAELEAALRRAPADPDLREALTAAVEECDRLAQLAEDLLVLARSGDGALAVRPEPLDAAELLERIRTRFSARARERGRELRVDAEPDLVVRADELRLSQALGNLVDNALRHGAGAITLSARRVGADDVLEVADEGAGPPSELRPRAFERFARGDEARTRGGAGLGLAIVRAVAEAHGGTAELGAGSAVRLRLPSQGDPSSRPYGATIPTEGGIA